MVSDLWRFVMKKNRIVVLDTGYDYETNDKLLVEKGVTIVCQQNGKILVTDGAQDDIGHGTAVAQVIGKNNPNVSIFPVKIIVDGIMANSDTLLYALEYIYDNVECSVINISLGICCCDKIKELNEICCKLKEKSIIIVAAYDNLNAISYPAAFECTIGISVDRSLNRDESYYIENSNDFVFGVKYFFVRTLGKKHELVSGSSFIAPEISAKILKMIQDNSLITYADIQRELSKFSNRISQMKKLYAKPTFNINKAIVLPFNKEMHSLASFQDLLPFKVVNFYDIKYSGNVGKQISQIVPYCNNSKRIQNIDKVDWEGDFDTVILGHTEELSKIIKRDLLEEVMNKCSYYDKNLYSCADIRNRTSKYDGLKYYCPYVENRPFDKFLKMSVIGKPILGIVGTGSSQGKFTIQLGLRRELQKRGYNIGQLGTEPTSILFGMDAVFPIGYEASVYTSGFSSIVAINEMLENIEKKDPDIIIFGSQSNTVSYHVGGPQDYPVKQSELIMGGQADAYILCVNNDATMPYIRRTINYLESIYDSKVICVVVSPLTNTARFSNYIKVKTKISVEEQLVFCENLKKFFDKDILLMDEECFFEKLAEIVERYFS